MKTHLKHIALFVLLATGLPLLQNCIFKKNNDIEPETYVLTGKLLQNCTEVPMPRQKLFIVKYNNPIFGNTFDTISTCTSDFQGVFRFKVPLYAKRDLRIEQRDIYGYSQTWVKNLNLDPQIRKDDTVRLGLFYRSYIENMVAKITVDTSISNYTDTLYLSYNNRALPIIDNQCVFKAIYNKPSTYRWMGDVPNSQLITWGITREEALQFGADSFRVERTICGVDTTYVHLSK